MTILIDADGCPVVDLTLQIARQFGVPVIILCDTVPGTGLSFLIGNPKAHFISLSDEDWTRAFNELERGKD